MLQWNKTAIWTYASSLTGSLWHEKAMCKSKKIHPMKSISVMHTEVYSPEMSISFEEESKREKFSKDFKYFSVTICNNKLKRR